MAAATAAAAEETSHATKQDIDPDHTEDGQKPSSRHPSPDLRADAPAFVPQDKEFKLPPRVKTARPKEPKKDIYHVFDAVPFTPSQGVKTPSPNNMAALRWQMFSPFAAPPYHPDSPTTVLRSNFAASDTSSNSDTSATQVMSPVHPAASMPYSPLMFYPVAIAPGLPGYPPPDMPHSPHGPPSPLMPGSPVGTPPGMRPGYPFMPIHLATPPPGSTFAPPMDLHGRRGAHMPPNPYMQPHRLSRTHMYPLNGGYPHGHIPMPPGMPYPAPVQPPPNGYMRRGRPANRSMDMGEGSDGSYGSDGKPKFKPRKNNSEPKLGADGMPRLNARQRRTLRRAKERALKALMETGSKLLQKAGLGDLQLAELSGSFDDDGAAESASITSEPASADPAELPQQLSPEQCEANRAEAAAAVSQALAECSVEPTKTPMSLDGDNIADLIQQLSLKQDEGIVDEKLIRDLQIIQGLLGALKQTPVPSKGTPQKAQRSPVPKTYERPAAGASKQAASVLTSQ